MMRVLASALFFGIVFLFAVPTVAAVQQPDILVCGWGLDLDADGNSGSPRVYQDPEKGDVVFIPNPFGSPSPGKYSGVEAWDGVCGMVGGILDSIIG